MEKYIELKEKYESILKGKIKEYKQKQKELIEDYREDEAAFYSIRENIADIFLKVFEVCVKGTSGENINALYEKYIKYFDTIPSQWAKKSELDEKNKMDKEYIIENLKLKTADEVKNIFTQIYKRSFGGEK